VFHLDETDQVKVLTHISKIVVSRWEAFITAQKKEIHGTSTMNGINFPYISLGTERYSKLLQDNGMKLENEYRDQCLTKGSSRKLLASS
jgi:hypothetical protein